VSSRSHLLFNAPKTAEAIKNNAKVYKTYSVSALSPCASVGSAPSPYDHSCFGDVATYFGSNPAGRNKITAAIVDSGIVPESNLSFTDILSLPLLYATWDKDNSHSSDSNWLSHASEIGSIFVGTSGGGLLPYADATTAGLSLVSVKVNFSGDPESGVDQKYGSMQLAVAMDKAMFAGARVVNLSLDYATKPDENVMFAEKGIMSLAALNKVYFIAAAGNDSTNIDVNPVYPARYDLNNIVVVGSNDSSYSRAYYSNYGNTVDLWAEGDSIGTVNKNGVLTSVSGTSYAAPLVAAALTSYLEKCPWAPVQSVIDDLYSSADTTHNLARHGFLQAHTFFNKGLVRTNCN
jgi:hypothetical protein